MGQTERPASLERQSNRRPVLRRLLAKTNSGQ